MAANFSLQLWSHLHNVTFWGSKGFEFLEISKL